MMATAWPSATTSSIATSIDFNLPAAGRGHRDFHLHRFDKGDVVAIANARAGCNGKAAHASGDFGDDSDIWHTNPLLVVGQIA